MTKRVLFFEPNVAGISGDMIVSALLELTAEPDKESSVLQKIAQVASECVDGSAMNVKVKKLRKKGIWGTYLDIDLVEEKKNRMVEDIKKCMKNVIDAIGLKSEDFVWSALAELEESEATVHHKLEDLHFHEVGSVDTIFDIVSAAYLLEQIGFFNGMESYSTPVNVGGGTVKIMHGVYPVPVPAVLHIFTKYGISYFKSDINEELTTPTGAALLAAMKTKVLKNTPVLKTIKVGHGLGTHDLEDRPNALRVSISEIVE